MSSSALRVRYLQLCCAVRLLGKKEDLAFETATDQDRRFREETYYRFNHEVVSFSEQYFEVCEIETDSIVRVKIGLLMTGQGTAGTKLGALMQLIDGSKLHSCITPLLDAAFCVSNLREDKILQSMSW